MPAAPDIAGFKAAQDRLREVLGRAVLFHLPVPPQYAPDVQLDPETGEPYDPTVVPISGGGTTDVAITAGVVTTVIEASDEADIKLGPAGVRSGESVALIIAPADKASVEDATAFSLDGIRYAITDLRFDGSSDRWVCFGEAR